NNSEPVNVNDGSELNNSEPVNVNDGSELNNSEPVNVNDGSELNNSEPVNVNAEAKLNNSKPVNVNAEAELSNPEPVNVNAEAELSNPEPVNVNDGAELSNPEPVNVNNGAELNSQEIENTTEGKNKLLFIIPVVVVLLVALFLVLRMVLFSPSRIYSSMIKKLGNSINEKTSDNKAYYNVSLKPTISGTGQKELEKLVNKVTIIVGANYNSKDKEIMLGLGAKYNNKDLISIDMNYKDQKAYLFLNKLLDYPIKMDTTSVNIDDNSISTENTKEIVNGFTDALSKSIKSDYITKSKETLTVDNKERKLNAYTLTLNEKNYKEIAASVKDKLLNDKEFIKAYAKATNSKEEDVKKILKNSLDENSYDNEKDIKVVLYTSGLFNNKFVGINIKEDDTSVEVINNKENNYDFIMKASNMIVKLNVNIEESNKKIDINNIKNAKDINELAQSDLLNAIDNIKKADAYSDLNNDIKNALGTDLDSLIDYLKLSLSNTSTSELQY
ncbi:MAG: hypothetical protein IJ094_05230, partial [Bacilli bacterium]|nr:hypothetical protein [Bacilli bacterium]